MFHAITFRCIKKDIVFKETEKKQQIYNCNNMENKEKT